MAPPVDAPKKSEMSPSPFARHRRAYAFVRRAPAPVKTFLIASGALGALLVFVTPPLQVADEIQHFMRAYGVSELKLLPSNADGVVGNVLPHSLTKIVVMTTRGIPFHPERKVDLDVLSQALRVELNPAERGMTAFQGSSLYSPLPYVPQATGIAIGRLLGRGPLPLIYFGRMVNLIAATLLTAVAIWLLPGGRWAACCLSLLPMAAFQRSSLSGDALTNSVGLLLVSLALFIRKKDVEPTRAVRLFFTFAAAALALCKPGLWIGAAIALLVPKRIFRNTAAYWRFVLGTALIVLVSAAVWAWLTRSAQAFPLQGASPPRQFAYVLSHPVAFAQVVAKTIGHEHRPWIEQFLGVLGWLDTHLNRAGLMGLGLLLAWISVADGPVWKPFDWRARVLCAICFALGLITVVTLLYLCWTPVGADRVVGVQGRYFLSFAALLLASMQGLAVGRSMARPRWTATLSVLFVAASGALSLSALVTRYYVSV